MHHCLAGFGFLKPWSLGSSIPALSCHCSYSGPSVCVCLLVEFGLGGAVAEVLAHFHPTPIEFVAVNDCFGQSGAPEELAGAYHLNPIDIAAAARKAMARK